MNYVTPNLSKLFGFAFSIPLTSVECERAFSRMNITKTDLKNRLSRDILNDLMLISHHGNDIKDFDPKPAIEIWKSQ